MPAGDAGLQQDERERILTTLRQYGAASGQYVHPWYVAALFDALAYLVENTPMVQAAAEENAWDVANELRTENGRLRVQLAAQQAVVDAARDYRQSAIDMMHVMETGGDAWRMARERRVSAESRMFSGLAALDKAHAAQPEGERG